MMDATARLRGLFTVIAVVILLACATGPVVAAPCLVTNGCFNNFHNCGCAVGVCKTGPNGQPFRLMCTANSSNGCKKFFICGWHQARTPSYTFLFKSANEAGTTGVSSTCTGHFSLWDSACTTKPGADLLVCSPEGGNFLGLDANFQKSALAQCISGLTVGSCYVVKFSWAGAQQRCFNGATCDRIFVELAHGQTACHCLNLTNGAGTGGACCGKSYSVPAGDQSTVRVSVPCHGFSGWRTCSFTFNATNTCETLSFLAAGGPGQVPPFALLDGASVNLAVPEINYRPSAVVPISLMLGLLLIVADRRRKSPAPPGFV
ncbi:MAG: hypothetical protein ACYCW6_30250 [Candidatus Xenobia bacterium]